MTPLQPILLTGSEIGLQQDRKPFLLPEQAFPRLDNAYVWRNRVKKKECNTQKGRLRRVLTSQAQTDADGTAVYDIADILASVRVAVAPAISETNAELQRSSVIIRVDPGGASETEFTDQGDGTFSRTAGVQYNIDSGTYIIYTTGQIHIEWDATAPGGNPPNLTAIEADFRYFPSIPVMGITLRERAQINDEETIFFDRKYAYRYTSGDFQEFITGTTWQGSDSDFFWEANYRGATPQSRLMFVSNDFINTGTATYDPIRYTDGTTWTPFTPLVNATNTIWQARIIVAYYGRLILLNTWEGLTAPGVGGAANIPNRCRFSQLGDPTAADAFREDIFGKGGFIDAPVAEDIMSARFFKNTLIVFFERSTWQLRYVGEYGLPFIWERISSDYGSESTFSTLLFDDAVLAIGDRAIIGANSSTVDRIDLKIPNIVFTIENDDNGQNRVHSARDFNRELAFWTYPNVVPNTETIVGTKFPNTVLVYNYRNQTWAQFRDNVTAFGKFYGAEGVTWDDLTTFWDDEEVFWDDDDIQDAFEKIAIGNQQGFILTFGDSSINGHSMPITGFDLTTSPLEVTIPNHNLYQDEIIQIDNLNFLDASFNTVATNLNNEFYKVLEVIDANTISITKWDSTLEKYAANFSFTPATTSTYAGGGTAALITKMKIQTKDFNPYMEKGMQLKLAYVDFLLDNIPDTEVAINVYINNILTTEANLPVTNSVLETYLTSPYYAQDSDYAWHRCFAQGNGQFIRVELTYNDELMNTAVTHTSSFVLNAIQLWVRPGSKTIF